MVATENGLVRTEKWQDVAQGIAASTSDHATVATNTLRDTHIDVLTRITPGAEYIKILLVRNKVVGAMLIGDTDLEETFENLILNQLDVGNIKADLLNPDIDIEDYFD